MPKLEIKEERLKNLLKSAVVEALEERREFVRDLMMEALEDIAMARAIKEGAATRTVDPAEVYKILGKKG
jgi:ribosomal protein L12E/L44/L45/RPP1/RPP2